MNTRAPARPFRKLLVANRGEIACRILRSARDRGLATVAVYSEADAGAPHVELADEALAIGPAEATQSYLNIERVVAAARRSGADAIHPGYGFLAENAAFARAVAEAGLVFVGPTPEAIAAMADKMAARACAIDLGVAVVRGYAGSQDDGELARQAAAIGFPLLVKAAAGGGGRGMRIVRAPAELAAAIAAARREASASFGCADLLLEQLVEPARHVEVQIVADSHGAVAALGDRDCSTQRRHQKLVEEAPAPQLDPRSRARLAEAAVLAARAIGYRGVGTVEFVVDSEGEAFFLEMNTRLQVEHGVTEMVFDCDLVGLQLELAAGQALPPALLTATPRGHAIELRLCAEDPARDFAPATGTIAAWSPPSGRHLRCDHGLRIGATVDAHYDSLLAKVIAWGEDREAARQRLVLASRSLSLAGVDTNLAFLTAVLESPEFVRGPVATSFAESAEAAPLRHAGTRIDDESWVLAAAFAAEEVARAGEQRWSPMLRGFRNARVAVSHLELTRGDERRELRVRPVGAGWQVEFAEEAAPRARRSVRLVDPPGPNVRAELDGRQRPLVAIRAADGELTVGTPPALHRFRLHDSHADADPGSSESILRAPTSGTVVALRVADGDEVEVGAPLLSLESMKIESTLVAAARGRVTGLRVTAGDRVQRGDRLLELAPVSAGTGEPATT